jgi:hypothetical protein
MVPRTSSAGVGVLLERVVNHVAQADVRRTARRSGRGGDGLVVLISRAPCIASNTCSGRNHRADRRRHAIGRGSASSQALIRRVSVIVEQPQASKPLAILLFSRSRTTCAVVLCGVVHGRVNLARSAVQMRLTWQRANHGFFGE